MSTTTASPSLGAAILTEARAYWHAYLWHHRDPRTRLLHRVGSSSCIAGMLATAMGLGLVWLPASIVVGYLFAFAGHYLVEGNRPLTLKHPVRAALCNWVMFVYEMIYDVDATLAVIGLFPPDTSEMDDT